MARKKRVVRRAGRRKNSRKVARGSRRAVRKVQRRTVSSPYSKRKLWIVLNNLLLFIALSLVSYVLTRFLANTFFIDLFSITAMVFGFVAVGFLIALIILLILSAFKKRR